MRFSVYLLALREGRTDGRTLIRKVYLQKVNQLHQNEAEHERMRKKYKLLRFLTGGAVDAEVKSQIIRLEVWNVALKRKWG